MAKWSTSALADESDVNTKMLHLDRTEAERQQDALRRLRRSLDSDGRRARAKEYKALANKQFGKEAWRVALVGYLAGVWMLRLDHEIDDPPCPLLLANHLSELESVVAALGPAVQPLAADEASATLRASLLVNLAAAALKLTEWRIARGACEVVLAAEPRHAKALWRLAKAHEGDSNLTGAIEAAARLTKCDPANKAAERLLEALRRRKAKCVCMRMRHVCVHVCMRPRAGVQRACALLRLLPRARHMRVRTQVRPDVRLHRRASARGGRLALHDEGAGRPDPTPTRALVPALARALAPPLALALSFTPTVEPCRSAT